MKNTDLYGQKADELLTTVVLRLSSDIADSVIKHYGNPCNVGNFEREEMMDDLISKLNDLD